MIFKLLFLFIITFACVVSQEFSNTSSADPTAPAPIPYSVHIVSSNVPNEQYAFDAVGMLQIYLEMYQSFDVAIPKFLQHYKEKHDSQIWKVSSGCSVLILPNETTYIKLREAVTKTEVNLFQ